MATSKEYLEAAIASIRILRKQSPLTEEEKGILLSFPGGGILKECGVFTDNDKPQWLVEGREELRSLLTPEEWEGIQNSGMQNSHYTLPEIRQAMWEALLPLIPHGNYVNHVHQVLDPGCGTAGFFWSMPNDVRLEYHGVDKDVLPVAIAQKAIGKSKHRIIKRDFFQYDPNPLYKYSLAIGNVPFVNGVNSIKVDGKKLGIAIHAQFFVKSVQCLEAGGVLCFLTSTTTLDARGEDYIWFRRWLHRKCEFIGALRLPADAVHYGGTQVTTDLIILRKRSQDSDEPDPNWVHVGESDLVNEHYNIPVLYNQWFIDNPQYLLGDRTISKVRGKNGNPTNCLALQSRPNFLKELREALENLTHQNNVSKENHTMSTRQVIIANDKFQKCSLLSFILLENPTQEGIEVHFPSDRSFDSLTDNEKTLLNQIKEQGFVPTQTHSHKFYVGFKKRTPEEYNRVISYMRRKVSKCANFGAKEVKIDDVENLESCRAVNNSTKPEPATTSSAPIVDAIAARLQPMFDELASELASKIQVPAADPKELQESQAKLTEYLHRWQKDQETIKQLTSEVERVKSVNKDLRLEVDTHLVRSQELIAENHALANSLKDSVEECRNLENSLQEAIHENENLRLQLAEFGVNPTNDVDLTDDEEELPPALQPSRSSFSEPDNDVDLTDDEEELPPALRPQSSTNDDDCDGFNIALLGE